MLGKLIERFCTAQVKNNVKLVIFPNMTVRMRSENLHGYFIIIIGYFQSFIGYYNIDVLKKIYIYG